MALISAMFPVAQQVRANRIVKGVSIPHPCGDPNLSKELDASLRREIIRTALAYHPRLEGAAPSAPGARGWVKRPEFASRRDAPALAFASPRVT